jgi:type VI secretion system secreted protein VgrG
VKVQFHWDREGTRDENSSLWIRVSHPWAGKGWGAVSIPRIGQEVIVDFLEGDPDRPIITGRVYNAEAMPPYGLPDDGVVSGIKSDTHKGSGYNEISMNDTAGKEKVTIHAQYDMGTTVLHDKTTTVKNDDTQTVENNRTITVNGTHTETIKKDTTITVSEGNLIYSISAGASTTTVKKDVIENYQASQATTLAEKLLVKAGDKVVIEAGELIQLVAGDSSIVLKKDGTITIIGKNVAIEGTAEVRVEAPKVAVSGGDEAKLGVSNQQVTCNTMKVNISGAAINASAVGMHEIAGALVKIN